MLTLALLILYFALAWFVARPVRLERTTCGFEVRRSIQLSYGRVGVSEGTRTLDHWGHNPVLYPAELHSPSKLNIAKWSMNSNPLPIWNNANFAELILQFELIISWRAWRDSNPRPTD